MEAVSAISAIYGMEPNREGEYPTVHAVGSDSYAPGGKRFTVSKIVQREQNFGDHGLLWFDVYEGERIAASMQGRAVAEIHFAPKS